MTENLTANRYEDIAGSVVKGDVRLRDGTFIGGSQINSFYNRFVTQIFPPQPPRPAKPAVPYVGDRPFRPEEQAIFCGRQHEIDKAVQLLDEPGRRALMVHGPTGAGKTSFISAGLLPGLNGTGTQVVSLRSYRHAGPLLRALLHGRAIDLGAAIESDAPTSAQARAITDATPEKLVLVLDQCERLFLRDVTPPERQDLELELRGLLQAVAPERLQILVAVRTRLHARLASHWDELLPGLLEASVPLLSLDAETALHAIMDPIPEAEHSLPGWDATFVARELVPQLDALSPQEAGFILPGDLQVVCDRVHLLARENLASDRSAQVINGDLYEKLTSGKSATWILDRHYKALWDQLDPARTELAEAIAQKLASRDEPEGIQPGDLSALDASVPDIGATLEEMARVGLLSWQITGDQPAYAFASDSTAQAVRRRLSPEVRKRLEAQAERDFAWYLWENEGKLAAPFQLNLVEDYYADGDLSAEQGLLFLRSAVESRLPVAHWLEQIDTAATRRTVAQLEAAPAATGEDSGQRPRPGEPVRLLGLEGPPPPPPDLEGVGSVTWSAIAHPSPACRETSLLTLMCTQGEDLLPRAAEVVSSAAFGRRRPNPPPPDRIYRGRLPAPQHWLRRWHLAELRGILADARDQLAARAAGSEPAGNPPSLAACLPRIQEQLRRLPPLARFEVWWWRFRRRLARDWDYVGRLALGGAVGAGLGLSLLRLVLALLMSPGTGGSYFWDSFPMGFVLGGALALGLLLVDVIRLRPAPREPAPAGQASPAPSESGEPTPQAGRRPLFFSSITLGTLGFALMHIFLNLLFGYRELVRQPQIAPLALLAGLGLSLAVWDWPRRSRRPAPATLLARLLAVAAVFALVHLGFIWIETQFDNPCASEPGLAFAWPSSVYRSLVPDGLSQWGLGGLAARLVDPVLCHEGVRVIWHRVVAVVDFAAVGVALAVGLMFGLSWAVRSHFERVERDRKAGP